MSERFTVMLNDKASYDRYKQDIVKSGGTIVHDLGATLLGFTAVIPPTLLQIWQSGNLADNGILTLDPDSTVTIQSRSV